LADPHLRRGGVFMAYLKNTRQNTGRMSNERLLKLSIRRVGLDPAAPKKTNNKANKLEINCGII